MPRGEECSPWKGPCKGSPGHQERGSCRVNSSSLPYSAPLQRAAPKGKALGPKTAHLGEKPLRFHQLFEQPLEITAFKRNVFIRWRKRVFKHPTPGLPGIPTAPTPGARRDGNGSPQEGADVFQDSHFNSFQRHSSPNYRNACSQMQIRAPIQETIPISLPQPGQSWLQERYP